MIEELDIYVSNVDRGWPRCHPPKYALARSHYKSETINGGVGEKNGNVRFPWVHKREPVAFHSLYINPSRNHAAVPSWWASHATLWLIDESGGESHF